MNDERIEAVEEYKFGVQNDQLYCARMVEEKAKAGAQTLNAWIRKCRTVGELRGETFVSYWRCL